jgi:HK97 family phage portal protein
VIDICRFFGVNPVKCFDLSKSSYSTVEATQLSFLTDTISPLLEKIELEFEKKVFKPSERKIIDVKFDISNLLKVDVASLAEYYTKLFNIGSITPNEIRNKLNMNKIEDGDDTYVQVNLMKLKDMGKNQDNKKETKSKTK